MYRILVADSSKAVGEYLEASLQLKGDTVVRVDNFQCLLTYIQSDHHFSLAVVGHCLDGAQDGEAGQTLLDAGVDILLLTGTTSGLKYSENKGRVIDVIRKSSSASIRDVLARVGEYLNNQQYRVLVVEDSPSLLNLLENTLSRMNFQVVSCTTLDEACELVDNISVDILLTDHFLPDGEGITLIKYVRDKWDKLQLPIIGISSTQDRGVVINSLSLGANDYVLKPIEPRELAVRVQNCVNYIDIVRKLEASSQKDYLTGLYNRKYMAEQIKVHLSAKTTTACLIDIDDFKAINDNNGHLKGDEALVVLANLLVSVFEGCYVCRWGGEEFLVLTSQPLDFTLSRLDKLSLSLKRPMEINFTVSVGVCQGGRSWEALISAADDALYNAKHQGKDQYVVSPLSGRNEA